MTLTTFPPPGSPPGSLVQCQERAAFPSRLRLICYGAAPLVEQDNLTVAQYREWQNRPGCKWLHLAGIQDLDMLRDLGAALGLHPLALEDILECRTSSKVEDYPGYLFIVCRLVTPGPDFSDEQISLFLGADYLLSIQETHEDYFAPIRERLRHGSGQMHQRGPDYLAYALLDYIVDAWFPRLAELGERFEELEDRLLAQPDGSLIQELQQLRRLLLRGRRILWPLREVVNNLLTQGSPLIQDHTRVYLRDCGDHAFQIIDLLENYRDLASALIDVYLSSINNRLNEIMKVLTVIATVFMPLTFIAGVYGMNFKTEVSPWNMPELGWYCGYPFALGLMAATVLAMVWYFKRKKWL
ncbi:MAG: magnesium/cobalt transporter CorA [Desulfobacca sp.]|uniref:magnesium/cobalt transporter CorA n=1 Tax=Desulfobacca sp. TaxID=2067990 RepID=UPI00404AC8B1